MILVIIANTTLILIILGIVILVIVGAYNKFIRLRNAVKKSWSGIDVQLKRRADLIPNLVNTAKGYAKLFRDIAEVEKHHEARFRKLLKMVEEGTVYQRQEAIQWRCSKCGHIHTGECPPDRCPVCTHEKEYFEPVDMSLDDIKLD